jgi:hypothetical protein
MLGDVIHQALGLVGLTPERVSRWLGGPCGCEARRQKLNQLTYWAQRVVTGRTDRARYYLSSITGDAYEDYPTGERPQEPEVARDLSQLQLQDGSDQGRVASD